MPSPLGDLPFHILLALGNEAAHGYALGKKIEARTGGRLRPTTGALYQAIRRLEEDGLLEAAPQPPDCPDARRKYFRLTERGREAVAREAARLEGLVDLARDKELYAGR